MSDPTVPRDAVIYIDRPKPLVGLVRAIGLAGVSGPPEVAVDTEADSLHSYFEKVCLIQITLGPTDYVVDPLADVDLSDLMAALKRCPLIFHGADYDLRMLGMSFDFDPDAAVFDTMLAAQLLGYEQIGMAALVERYFEVVLPKKYQRHDWSARPLGADVVEYARNDTRYLGPLVAILRGELAEKGRTEWHRQACERVVEAARSHEPRQVVDPWRVKGSGSLKNRSLALLRELWLWRDAEARNLDRPAFKVLGNKFLVELAEWADKHPDAPLSKGPKLPRNMKGRRLREMSEAIERGRKMPRKEWPPKSRPQVERDTGYAMSPRDCPDLLAALTKARDKVAKPLELAGSLLAPRAAIEAIACRKARSAEDVQAFGELLPWQVELLAPVFLPVLTKRRPSA